jgi:ubiquinol-cytochrome c reductase cytochrome c subunit
MGLRLLRRVLIPFAALVVAACLGTFVMGRSHATTSASSDQLPAGLALTASSSSAPKGEIADGYRLFQNHCSFCHGTAANGLTGIAPNLQGLGPGVIDLWLSTGWMPLRTPTVQPDNKPPSFDAAQIRDIALWVGSLRSGGVPIAPTLDLKKANLADGFELFTLNCAPCHTVTGAGDALADGYHAPSLQSVTASQIWEAVRSGPQNMPQFSTANITPSQLNDIIKYVTGKIEHPSDPGGLGLGGVGPVAEGFVGLFVGVGACMLAAYWVGDRTEREEPEDEHQPGLSQEHPGGAHA